MRYKLTYKIGLAVVQEWILTSQSLAYWKKHDLLVTGRYNDGKFIAEATFVKVIRYICKGFLRHYKSSRYY